MSFSPSSRRAKPRWLLALVAVAGLSAAVIGVAAAAIPVPLINDIPAAFFTVEDEHGPNDVPAQSDLTQMGRDDEDANIYRLFWSWDEIDQWTGSGQTGDACALFDNDGDGKINFVACARVSNTNADPTVVEIVPQGVDRPVFLFSCSDAKNDRCTQPQPVAYDVGQADAGVLGTLAKANLITGTDPFYRDPVNPVGSDFPYDSTIEVQVQKSILPDGTAGESTLVNVCSYPSAGNGGNNNPFDCVVSPGGGFLVIKKDAGEGVTSPKFTFSVTNPTATREISGTGTADAIAVLIAANPSTTITETAVANWSLTGISCKLEGGASTGELDAQNSYKINKVAVQSGKITTCTFTNRPVLPKLTVTKVVVNDNGGTKVVADFPLFVDTTSVQSGAQNTFTAGNYTVSETPDPGYSATITGDCAADGSITLNLGDVKSCTITNDDKAPSLTLDKIVVNDNGGTAAESAWTLTANGGTAGTLSGPGAAGSTDVVSGATFKVGTYALSESAGPGGYTPSAWSCVKNDGAAVEGSSITLGLGDTATCTITNDDNAPSLTLIKTVTNDNGGTALVTDWTLRANKSGTAAPPYELSGTTPVASGATFEAGTYDLSEADGPSGYTAGSWSCVTNGGDPVVGSSITLVLGDSATCTINNNDDKAQPAGTTVQSWVLHDTLTITGLRAGASDAASADVVFSVYSDDQCETLVGSETVSIDVDTAATADGIEITDSGFYYWTAQYSGDQYNEGFTTACGDEITQILAKDADRDDFAPIIQ